MDRRSVALLFAVSVCSAACESKLAAISDASLQEKMMECNSVTDPSPGMAIACDNYRRECRARRDQGRYVC